VRVAMGESPWTRFYPDKVYTLTLQADGGLSLSARAMDGMWKEYRDALLRARSTVGAAATASRADIPVRHPLPDRREQPQIQGGADGRRFGRITPDG
jgi:hypothetical protein